MWELVKGEVELSELVNLGLVTVIGTLSFFLKRVINRSDELEKEIDVIKKDYVTKDIVNKVENSLACEIEKVDVKCHGNIKKLEDDTKDKISKMEESINNNLKTISEDIKEIQKNHISKEDLHRQGTSIDLKLEKMMDYIVKGGN